MPIHHLKLKTGPGETLAEGELVIISQVQRQIGAFLHTADYYELMYVLEGKGTHSINGYEYQLEAGQLIWIAPTDVHDIGHECDQELCFFNFRFNAALWQDFCAMVEIDSLSLSSATELGPGRFVLQTGENRQKCDELLHHHLALLQAEPTRLNVCTFWISVLPFFKREESKDTASLLQPAWLVHACRIMHDPASLAIGLPRFLELSGVSMSHLSRVLKSTTGQSPTEYINSIRLKRVVGDLVNTADDITEIAMLYGFENLSYFYRLFRKRYGKTPRAYRLGMRNVISPEK